MICNSWKARVVYALVLYFSGVVHHAIVGNVSNTPEGMFVFHGAAAMTDFMLLLCASSFLKGDLLDDMENMCILSMTINFAGWILYLAYAPPMTFEYAIGILGYGQYLRLILAGCNVDFMGINLVRSHHYGGS